MTSNEVSMAGLSPSFRIQGQVYHLTGSIVPTQGESHKFAQITFCFVLLRLQLRMLRDSGRFLGEIYCKVVCKV